MAKWLGLPVLLVVDARSMARSAGALVHGFATFDPDLALAGVVFNRIAGAAHLQYLKQALSQVEGISCLGGLPRDSELAIPERHLGLFTAEDHPLEDRRLEHLAGVMEEHLDLEGLLASLPVLAIPLETIVADVPPTVRLGVARDQAFCFYYPENLELLARFGAELVPFSPLKDRELPENLHGLYLGGGYPELYAAQLAANAGMKQSIAEQAGRGLPIYAECGGLMYLSREIEDLEGNSHAMAGVLPLQVRMLPRLKALGYREVTLTAPGLLGPAGTRARGHEFHYSEIIDGTEELAKQYQITGRQGQKAAAEGFSWNNVLASYVHLHFGSNPETARHLLESCLKYRTLGEGTRGS
jgi:cobyrinic acid a,c-diamide synthase